MDHDGQQVTGGQQGGDQQHRGNQNREGPRRALQRGDTELPLADKAPHGRNAHQAQGRDQEAPEGPGKLHPHPPELGDIPLAQLVDEHTGAEEQRPLADRVGRRMEQGPVETGAGHQAQAQHDIAQLADGGVGQALFRHLLPIGHHGAHEHRETGQAHPCDLDPAPPEQVRPHGEVHQPDHRQNARFCHDARQQRRGRSRGHGMGRGQPAVEGIHARLGSKAHNA